MRSSPETDVLVTGRRSVSRYYTRHHLGNSYFQQLGDRLHVAIRLSEICPFASLLACQDVTDNELVCYLPDGYVPGFVDLLPFSVHCERRLDREGKKSLLSLCKFNMKKNTYVCIYMLIHIYTYICIYVYVYSCKSKITNSTTVLK